MANLSDVTTYIHGYLRINEVKDHPNACNGLQVENSGSITRIGSAVDACEAVIKMASERRIDFLLVHHGLFWTGVQPVTGAFYRKLKVALDKDMAVYSAHLPLDVHPEVGNNVLLAQALGLNALEPFFFDDGQFIGARANCVTSRDELVLRLEKSTGAPVHICAGGPEEIRNIGVVTGGAGEGVARAAREGVDTFVTGEGPHWSYTAAEELGINVLYAGHYATEVLGVRALAAHLAERFGLGWEFIDHPTGL
jgi:dinuclear metal center YbgI/SA1388 family protein